jgi:hypothetical protein
MEVSLLLMNRATNDGLPKTLGANAQTDAENMVVVMMSNSTRRQQGGERG